MHLARGVVNLTAHVRERYVQRILGIEDKYLAKKYLADNHVEVSFEVWKLFSKAKLYFKNYTVSGKGTTDIYIFKNIIFIVGQDSKLITLWKINNKTLMKDKGLHKNIVKRLYFNKSEIVKLDISATKIGRKGDVFKLTVSNLQDILLEIKDETSISLIKEKIEALQNEDAILKEKGQKLIVNRKNLIKENNSIMHSILRGYIDEIEEYFNSDTY